MKKLCSRTAKSPWLLALGAAALVCASSGNSAGRSVDAPETLSNGLARLPNTKVALAYLRPGTDLKKYKTVHIQTLIVPPDARDTAPRGERPRIGGSYLLRDEDVADIQKLYDDAFRKVFNSAGFTVVDSAQAGTLVIATQVTDITLKAPLEHTRGGSSQIRTYSEGGGSISIKAALADGGSGEVIAAVADSRYANDLWQRNTRVQNIADLKRAFSEWARALTKRMAGGSG